ncbi:MAG: alanyl-tRNA editing protein [Candidatus Woesearchaeota archaeon]
MDYLTDNMIINPKIDSALHVLKGAVQKVTGATITTGVWQEGNMGRLTVEFDRDITEEENARIEGLAADKIRENAEIQTLKLERTEAEQRFGNAMYDKFPVPAHIRNLTVIYIPDWNVNCCIGQHTKMTGEIGVLSIRKTRFREAKKELEIGFEIN